VDLDRMCIAAQGHRDTQALRLAVELIPHQGTLQGTE
jgi:hypothetical protein